jgi:hypothetical protein
MIFYKLIIFFAVLVVFGCSPTPKKSNIIVFSCIKCSGCVENNLNYIIEKRIDLRYKIILDTSCYEEKINILRGFSFTHMSYQTIESTYGQFGNFVLIDSAGKKTEFMTDMHLANYIH